MCGLSKLNVILSLIAEYAFTDKKGYRCEPEINMTSSSLLNAKKECGENELCSNFYDLCEEGQEFLYCKKDAEIKLSSCGTVLYKKGNA